MIVAPVIGYSDGTLAFLCRAGLPVLPLELSVKPYR